MRFCYLTLFLLPLSASAQIAYFSDGGNNLVRYHLDTHQVDPPILMLETVAGSSHEVQSMDDIASDFQGQLYGITFGTKLFKIDSNSGALTYIGPTGVDAVGMAFNPTDGKLWAAGNGPAGPHTLYTIDLVTAVPTNIATIHFAQPGGDIAFSPAAPHNLYLAGTVSAHTDRLYQIDQATGIATPVGDFGCSNVYGMDFTDQGEDIFAMCEGGNIILMKRVATTGTNQWVPQATEANYHFGCDGATKSHCTPTPVITLQGGGAPADLYSCGETPILSGAESLSCTTKYEWKVAHVNNESGLEDQSITITGDGIPGILDMKDARLAGLDINHHAALEVRKFNVHLTNWCKDSYEPSLTTQVTFSVAPIHLTWKIGDRPWEQLAGGYPEYYYWELNNFDASGNTNIAIAKWEANGHSIADGIDTTHTWEEQDAGVQAIKVVATFKNGCVSEDTRDIKILDDNLGIPNAFTPNNHDGVNDTFEIQGTNSSMLEYIDVRIFNRFGNLVFERIHATSAKDAAWDGRLFGGKPSEPSTVYVYQIEYKMRNGAAQSRPVHKTGTITVM